MSAIFSNWGSQYNWTTTTQQKNDWNTLYKQMHDQDHIDIDQNEILAQIQADKKNDPNANPNSQKSFFQALKELVKQKGGNSDQLLTKEIDQFGTDLHIPGLNVTG